MSIRFELTLYNGTVILNVPAEGIVIYGNDGFKKRHSIPDGAVFNAAVEYMADPETGDRLSSGMTEELLRHIHDLPRPQR